MLADDVNMNASFGIIHHTLVPLPMLPLSTRLTVRLLLTPATTLLCPNVL